MKPFLAIRTQQSHVPHMALGEQQTIHGHLTGRVPNHPKATQLLHQWLCLPDRALDARRGYVTTANLSKRLANGVPLTLELLDSCAAIINHVEDRMLKITRRTLIDSANTELIRVEVERLGMDKEAA